MKHISLSSLLFLVSCSQESEAERFDHETGQQPVLTREEINAILDEFEMVSYEDLSIGYKDSTDPRKKFRKKLSGTDYFLIRGKDIYKYVVGKSRVMDFLCTDKYYTTNEEDIDAGHIQYWLTDRNLLYMILDFMNVLESKGLNKYGFHVRESHRHPYYNEVKGGASQSQHIYGKAADLEIEDINWDGSIDDKDKEICLKILENIVGDKGGMGLYPETMVIHIDTRGHRARWNSY